MLKVNDLRKKFQESTVKRENILTLLEAMQPPVQVMGKWKGCVITLPDGIELHTKYGMKNIEPYDVYVSNINGQYRAFKDGSEIELSQVVNESRVTAVRFLEESEESVISEDLRS